MATGLLDYKWIFTIFIFADLQVAAGPVRTGVSCVTSVHPDGSASYQLSQPPPSHHCGTTWEDGNRIVVANDLEGDPSRVTHLTNQSITLNVCVEHVIHGVECLSSGVSYKTECRANCAARENKVTAGPVRSVSCVTSVHADGSASYQLSQPPPPYHSCEATWEDGNRIVIAAGSDRSQSRVSHLTNQSIALNVCLGHVTYRVECFLEGILYKTECRANCSARPNKGPALTCLGTWCTTELWRVVLAVVLPLGAVVLVSCLVYRLWVHCTSKRSFSVVCDDGPAYKVSYSAVASLATLSVDAAGEDAKPSEDRDTGF